MARKRKKSKTKLPRKQKPFLATQGEKTYVVGHLRLHPKGFGFVECEDKVCHPQDIFIPRHHTNHGVDGDRVEVLVRGEPISDKGPEGRIVTILERSRTHLAGIISQAIGPTSFLAYAPLLGRERRVVIEMDPGLPLRIGDRIIMEIVEWGDREQETLCKVSHILGNVADPSCDIVAAIEEYELRDAFPHPVIDEAKALGDRVQPKDLVGREDLRDLCCFTIDPDTARDFDDALSLSKDARGHYHLAVHIADVSHYVSRKSELDKEARLRCNSTYFPGRCVPMLPPELSNELCSLKPLVNRLAVTVFIELDPHGEVKNTRITRSVIRSRKRFTYHAVKQILDGKRKSPYADTLHMLAELCRLLKKRRYERGSIEFALPELVVLCDEEGDPHGTEVIAYDITHQMVEECMLQANETVARHLAEQGKNLAYRVHEEPSEDNIRDFAMLANAFGFRLADKPTVQELQQLFDEAEKGPHGPHLATNYIRKMRLAVYSPDNIGHYGLNLSHYCHFTSPIRRYIDLVVHRILFGDEHEWEHLQEIAQRCSEQERISAKAEGSVILLKKLRLLAVFQKEEPHGQWNAIVTKVKKFGIYFEVIDIMLEGFLPISEIGDDYFIADEIQMSMKGQHTGIEYRVGDPLLVILRKIDFILLDHRWYLVPEKASSKKKERKNKRKHKKI